MIILGISTSAKHPSAALSRDGEIAAFIVDESGKSHSATLMGLIEKVLSDSGASPSDIDAIAVDIGPGSFTGVRIGVSCANAMAMALSVPVLPVCSLDALRNIVPKEGTVCSMIDCRNGNCYAACYENGVTKTPPCAAVVSNVLKSLLKDASVVGDCFDNKSFPDARLVLIEALDSKPVSEAVPMYLRPSQAERMKK